MEFNVNIVFALFYYRQSNFYTFPVFLRVGADFVHSTWAEFT